MPAEERRVVEAFDSRNTLYVWYWTDGNLFFRIPGDEWTTDDRFSMLLPDVISELTFAERHSNWRIGLDLRDSQITDAALANLRQLPMLKIVLLPPQITDAGMAHLGQAANLERIQILSADRITDQSLIHLKGLTKLTELELWDSQITDEGLSHLQGKNQLKELELIDSRITGSGLKHLKDLENLRSLDLTGAPLTADYVEHLSQLKQLTELRINRTGLSRVDVQRLRNALPTCRIYWEGAASDG